MEWHFPKSDPAGEVNIASYSRTVIEGERTISALEIFVREVLQNSLDAAQDGNQKVKVQFRLRALQGAALTNFFQAMNWPALKRFAAAASRASSQRMDRYRFPDPTVLEQGVVRILEINETNTIGLIGPDRMIREEDYRTWPGETPKAYRALCRDDARREKVSLGSGGTFGLGKAVLWRASAIQTVLFFSRLSIPFEGVVHRAAGQARLCTHIIPPNEFRGIGFGGAMDGPFCAPLRNQTAVQFARAVGLSPRSEDNAYGTSIIIPFWEQPKPQRDDDEENSPGLIAKYAARFFWPAIDSGKLEVSATDGDRTSNAAEHTVHYLPFIELYRRMQSNQPLSRDARFENIPVVVPRTPPPLERGQAQTFVRCGASLINPDNPAERVQEDFLGKVAEIRGQGMVIGYQKLTGNTRIKPFVGLALGGRVADPSDAGIQGDMLLGFSEHVTHTRWDEDAEALDTWQNSRPRVRDLLSKMKGYFIRVAGNEAPTPTGDLSALQQGLIIPGIGRGPIIDPPPQGVPQLKPTRFEREGNHYTFEFYARMEASAAPMRLTMWIEPGVESGRPSKDDRLEIEQLNIVPRGLTVERAGNGKVHVEIPALQDPTRVRISGTTTEMPPQLLSVTEGRLRAKLTRLSDPEEREQETSPENIYA
jgi:RNA polymerase primary sigma factor